MKIDEIRYQLESIRSHELNASQAQALFYAQQELDQYQRLLERTRWIPVSEQLPSQGKFVLGLTAGGDILVAFTNVHGRWLSTEDWNAKIAHWMPLPEPPEYEE